MIRGTGDVGMFLKAGALEILGLVAVFPEAITDRVAEVHQATVRLPVLQKVPRDGVLGLIKEECRIIDLIGSTRGKVVIAFADSITKEAKEDLIVSARVFRMIFKAFTLKILHFIAIFPDLVRDW